MPQNITLAAFALGAVLLLLALSSGGFKIFGAEMSGGNGRFARLLAGILGAGFLIYAISPNIGSDWPNKPSRVPAGDAAKAAAMANAAPVDTMKAVPAKPDPLRSRDR